MTLAFADTYNMIAYLTKSDASEGFNQIINFLNASSIQYVLTEKVLITKATVRKLFDWMMQGVLIVYPMRRSLQSCQGWGTISLQQSSYFIRNFLAQWKFLIQTILQCMSAKRTSWNEFSSSMASVVICLSTVADDDAADDVPAADVKPTPPSLPPTNTPPPPQELPSTSQVVPTLPSTPIAQPSSPLQQQQPSQPTTISMDLYWKLWGMIAKINADEDVILEEVDAEKDDKVVEKDADDDVEEPVELQEVIEVVTTAKLMTKVVTAAAPITADKKDKAYARELEAELNKNINWDDVIEQVKEKGKQDNAVLRGMSYDDIRPIFEKYFNSNAAFLEKSKEQLEEEESKALKRKTESSDEKAVKKQKLDEEMVQEIFASSKPKNFSDDFLLTTLTYMSEKPDVEGKVWKNQRNDLAGREKISIDNVHFGSDDEQYKTYCCLCKLMLLDDAADIKLKLLEQSAVVGIVPIEMELILEQTQQGISHEVSVSAEGVEE
nr:hypothetical protein [Tanacetum cinerariifolium]